MGTGLVRKTAEGIATAPRQRSWRLVGARVAVDAHRSVPATVEIEAGRIREIAWEPSNGNHRSSVRSSPWLVDLSGYLLLPGLINAHDHLEFNLFPRLGRGPYRNADEWARDVYHPDRSPILEQLMVPKPVRYWWGAIKNLFCGVTTVCHHNPRVPEHLKRKFPVRVVDRYGWSHSFSFGGNIAEAFHSTPRDAPFVIHLAEGTDEQSRQEIYRLEHLGALDYRTLIVHGVGMDETGHSLLEEREAGLVWCPSSNVFTLGTTLDKKTILEHRNVALGSDSALTAQGDLLDEIQFASQNALLTPETIYPLVTASAARVLRLTSAGAIRMNGPADLIAVADNGEPPGARLAQITTRDIDLVMVGGEPKLLCPAIGGQWPSSVVTGHELLQIEDIERLVKAPIRALLKTTREYLGQEISLAGKRVHG